MLKKTTLFASLLFGGVCILWGLLCAQARDADVEASVLQHSLKKEMSMKTLAQTAHQRREGVVKEIYFSEPNGTRLRYRIESAFSQLTLRPEGSHFDLIEQLHDVHCWMQDALTVNAQGNPLQQLRYLEAAQGIYRYSAQQFLAKSVALSLYQLNHHALPIDLSASNPFLKGVAEDVAFTMTGKTPQFQARQFKASLGQEI